MFENFNHIILAEEDQDFAPTFSITDEEEDHPDIVLKNALPLLALKNTVLFPGLVIPITVGRAKSKMAIQKAYSGKKLVGVFSQKELNTENPLKDDLFGIGTVARIVKLLKMPDGNTTAILQGRQRAELQELTVVDPSLEGVLNIIKDDFPIDNVELNTIVSSIRDSAKKIIELSPTIPSEAVVMLQNIKKSYFLLNFIASNLNIDVLEKQSILEESDPLTKGKTILQKMEEELQMLEVKSQIESKVRTNIEKQQRDFFLNQQLKTIQDELGENPQKEEIKELELKGKDKDWPEPIAKRFEKEINRLKRMNPQVTEYSIQMNYLDTLIQLPWNEVTDDNFDLKKVRKVLDSDHHGLEEIKDRIIEHLAVLKLKGDMKAPILCLVGPPGVGKTSLGKSIANALSRKFVRMSLGGLHDESEIRGHRKTYIGAMPGRIIQSIKKVKSSNPVFILDEIDKIGKDFRGDPSSALLEVLDPEQNHSFYDNYLELEYDLSKVMFIATANSLSTIQPALRDRMEIIQLEGYSTEEKVEIAKKHLLPKQIKDHGLKKGDIGISDTLLSKLIQDYTRESGVRSLDRAIAGVMRSTAKKVALEEKYNKKLTAEDLVNIHGQPKFRTDKSIKRKNVGVVVGLAWTRVGGDILFIETSLSKGKPTLTLTGSLGDVMKESATTALSFIKANHKTLGIDPASYNQNQIHIHVPQGGIPKDGPSAGITILTALTSRLSGKKIKANLAMSGEITLRGKVLPVGGIKEKVLAAKRSGIKEIILSEDNKQNVDKINDEYLKGLTFHYVETMQEVLEIALGK